MKTIEGVRMNSALAENVNEIITQLRAYEAERKAKSEAYDLIVNLVEELYKMGVDIVEIETFHPEHSGSFHLFAETGCDGPTPGGAAKPILMRIRDRLTSLGYVQGVGMLRDRAGGLHPFAWNAKGDEYRVGKFMLLGHPEDWDDFLLPDQLNEEVS